MTKFGVTDMRYLYENDKRFLNFELIDSKESTKKVKILTYSDNKFLIYAKIKLWI